MSGGNWKEMFEGIETNDIGLVEYYLKLGVDPNYQHPEILASPLVESIRLNHLEIAKLLLDNKADPNIKDAWGKETPLFIAKKHKNKAAIQLLKLYL